MSQSRPFDITAHLPALLRYARALTRDSADADDLVQETLMRAYENRARFRPDGELKSWLFSILHNTFVSGLRRRRSYADRMDRVAELGETEAAPEQETHLRLAQIRAAFLTLPNEQREALHLVAIEGMAYGEAADVIGIPLGTLMSRLGRARAALRDIENGSNVVPLRRIRDRNGEK